MASDGVLKIEFMTKRSVMKSRFKSENFKGRWFVLTSRKLAYYDTKIDQSAYEETKYKPKGEIQLKNVKVVETVDQEHLANKPFGFQVMYTNDLSGDLYTLYIIAVTDQLRNEWITIVRQTSLKCGGTFFNKYHNGVYSFKNGRWTCCEKINKQAPGCQEVTPDDAPLSTSTSFGRLDISSDTSDKQNDSKFSNDVSRQRKPLPVPPVAQQKPAEATKEMVVALYDYQQVESDDLSLEKGEEYEILARDQQFWWKAKNKLGIEGFIPSNYVQKVEEDDLGQYDWFYPHTSRVHSEEILRKEGKEGCFLVRESSSKGMYTLSIYAKENGEPVVKHYHIKKKGNGDFYLTERHAYNTIPTLIHYHKHNCAGLIVRLRSSPTKGRESLTPSTPGLGHDKYEVDPSELVLMEDLGQGQFGTVKLAMWKNSKKVAVKMMKEDTMSDDDFIDEAKVMKELQHTNLVQLYGVSTKKKPIYIITEFMKHGSLLSYLRRHKNRLQSKTPTLVDMSFQVSEAMEYLENKKFIHRDLAARNCLVGENDIVKVGDFGLARFVLDNEYTSSQGTKFPIRWAPPEVLSYTRFSTKSDVWSFGILMWEIFTVGDLPYGRVKNQDVVTQVCHQNKRLDRPSKCPEPVYEVMLGCWAEKPERRPDFVEIKTQLDDIQKEAFDYAE